ncbi:MAG: hypothetical protein BRC29_05330 [Nanohaloarchaea archaeon SW_7_43_1]|nr:MAG: hypothetical protein BRC29_05330 [Nanohaloarchaea archaeon SW_7_43_1]
MRKHTVYVDQSGKIENQSSHIGMAFSDESGKEFTNAIFIDKKHKKRIKEAAKKELGNIREYRVKLFAFGLFMLIQNDLHRLKEVRVDREYEGKLPQIKHHLFNFLNNNTSVPTNNFPVLIPCHVHNEIKKPECHDLAYRAREKELDSLLESDYDFLKAMVLRSNK